MEEKQYQGKPYQGEPAPFNNGREALAYYIRAVYGSQALQREQVKSLLEGLVPRLPALYRNVILSVFNSDAADILKAAQDAPEEVQENAYDKAANVIVENYGTNRRLVEVILTEFIDALGWHISASTPLTEVERTPRKLERKEKVISIGEKTVDEGVTKNTPPIPTSKPEPSVWEPPDLTTFPNSHIHTPKPTPVSASQLALQYASKPNPKSAHKPKRKKRKRILAAVMAILVMVLIVVFQFIPLVIGGHVLYVNKSTTELDLYRDSISSISGLRGLTNLVKLNLGNNLSGGFSDMNALSGLTKLEWLYLDRNWIRDISALSGLTNLTELNLGDNMISDISALSGLTNLVELNLGDNNIRDISALSGLTNLVELNLSNNDIRDISALSGFTNLVELNLSDNKISNISALRGLNNLKELNLENCNISDFSVLKELAKLETLNLKKNDSLTQSQKDDLEKALPECTIWYDWYDWYD
jgi:Leucine-rich repeat (LRR) protein